MASQVACANPQSVLTQLVEARRLAAELHVQFTQAADAANRAVMMTAASARARKALEELRELAPEATGELGTAAAALDGQALTSGR